MTTPRTQISTVKSGPTSLVFATLMVLTIVTVAVSRLHLPMPAAVAVALIVATIKGGLVAQLLHAPSPSGS